MSTDLSVRPSSISPSRLADGLLRALGGREVLLRMPAPAQAGSDAEQLGSAVPTFMDWPLQPVVFRHSRQGLAEGQKIRSELLVSASAVLSIVTTLSLASAQVLFFTAVGLIVDGQLILIESAGQTELFGQPYLFRLLLRAA